MPHKGEIRNFIIENFLYGQDDPILTDDVSFMEKGVIDSTGVLELISFVQETYGIQVADEEIVPDNFDSLNKIKAFIMRKQEEKTQNGIHASQESAIAG